MNDDPFLIADRGNQAAALLEHPLFIEANKLLAKKIVDKFAATDPRDEKELAYVRRLLQAQADFNILFADIVRSGENAKAEIKDNERRSLLGRLVA